MLLIDRVDYLQNIINVKLYDIISIGPMDLVDDRQTLAQQKAKGEVQVGRRSMDVKLFRSGSRKWRIGLINGPNMPNLHNRHPDVYGPPQTIQQLEERVVTLGKALGVEVIPFHTNFDGEVLEWLHKNAFADAVDGKRLHAVIINPAGLNIYGENVRHCLEDSGLPYVEVHFSNIVVRELKSVFTRTAVGICHGLRKHSYTAALVAVAGFLDDGDFVRPLNYTEPMPA